MRVAHHSSTQAISLLLVVLALHVQCSSAKPGGTPADASRATIDAAVVPIDAAVEVAPIVMRGILHVHSPYSHDACDGQGLTNGIPNAVCRAELRQALCDNRFDFAMLTDHPSFMRDHPFEDVMLHNADTDDYILIDSEIVANRIDCGDGHTVIVTVGYEGSPHLMPLGLRKHIAEEHYAGMSNAKGLADAQAHIAALEAAGAVTSMAHSEEDDVSAQLIIDSGLDSMEWYNVHGNLLMLLGGDSIAGSASEILDLIGPLGKFMMGSGSGAHPDLVNLLVLQTWPQEGFDKWQEVQEARPITGVLGSDVHRNVSVDPVCTETNPVAQAACIAAAEALLPDYMHSLIAGGSLELSDGDRLDSYVRVMRWLSNRVIVQDNSYESLMAALKQGRNYGVFTVFGEPEGFRLTASALDTGHAEIGESIAGPVELALQIPTATPITGGAQFSAEEAANATLRILLKRSTAAGTTTVSDSVISEDTSFSLSEAGAYHVEIWVTPHHLDAALGSESQLADSEYLWLITNSIVVQ